MSDCLIYTFKNFPYKAALGGRVFEFRKLKADLKIFEAEIKRLEPKIILGVAKSPSRSSRFETRAVNVFARTKKVNKIGVPEYALDYPVGGFDSIAVNTGFTDTFCNWTMYKISELIAGQDIKLQFIHVSPVGLSDLQGYLRRM
jgi:hypothetical protein